MAKKYPATKTAYSYLESTGEYSGATLAQLSPMDVGVYLLPANATFEEPPADDGTNWPYWNGAAWELRDLDVQQ